VSVVAYMLACLALGLGIGASIVNVLQGHDDRRDHARLVRLERVVHSLCTNGEASVHGYWGRDGRWHVSRSVVTGCTP
jgi:hypothetical protein